MNLIKTGKYISLKRKQKNMTQKDLASMLGMSDKSVSKWERGICLPDVSLFEKLCSILEISVNELLAGEDISTSDLIVKANENIIDFAKDSKRKEMNLKRIIVIVTVFALFLVSFIGYGKYKELSTRNTVSRLGYDSSKVQAVELLLGPGAAHIYDFEVEDFKRVLVHVLTYKSGELIDNSSTGIFFDELVSTKNGELIIGIDLNNYVALLAYNACGYKTVKKEVALIEKEEDKTSYGLTVSSLIDTVKVDHNVKIPILALIFDKNEVRSVVDLSRPIENQLEALTNDEYAYIFSIEFTN